MHHNQIIDATSLNKMPVIEIIKSLRQRNLIFSSSQFGSIVLGNV